MKTITSDLLRDAVLTLLQEAYVGPENPEMPWFADNAPETGVLGTLDAVSFEQAGTPLGSDGTTVAAHTAHLRFALSLANRAFRGENPYPDADWEGSWATRSVTQTEWDQLRSDLRDEYTRLREALSGEVPWDAPMVLPGTLGQIAHGAWHLGAIRTLLEML